MKFQDLFRGYTGSHGVSIPTDEFDSRGKKKHKHLTRKGAPTDAEWEKHLSGEGPGLGVIPLLDDNRNVWWGAIDIDKYKGELNHAALEADIGALPLSICLSKSRGAHLYLFCKEPVSAKLVIERLTEWADAIGFSGSEIFPKQHSRLVGTEDQGNWINLPYFGNERKGFVGGQEVDLPTFLDSVRLVGESDLIKLKVEKPEKKELFDDGPPCLQTLFSQGVAEGGRNNTMFNVGLYLKMKEPDTWQELFPIFNKQNLDVPLEDSELRDSARTIERKAYNYTCSKHPLNNHCNRGLCVKRPFGIAKGSTNEQLNVTLSGLTKIDTTTPRWFINIDGVRAEIPDTKVLMDQKQFGLLVVERVHKVLTPVKPLQWNNEVQRLLTTVEVVEAPPEASPEGQFIHMLNKFIELRGNRATRDTLNSGRPWICEKCNKAYFRPADLQQYLKRESFREINNTQQFAILNDYGVKKGRFNIKGATVVYWSVPMPQLQSEAFDVPQFEQKQEEKKDGTDTGFSTNAAF